MLRIVIPCKDYDSQEVMPSLQLASRGLSFRWLRAEVKYAFTYRM